MADTQELAREATITLRELGSSSATPVLLELLEWTHLSGATTRQAFSVLALDPERWPRFHDSK